MPKNVLNLPSSLRSGAVIAALVVLLLCVWFLSRAEAAATPKHASAVDASMEAETREAAGAELKAPIVSASKDNRGYVGSKACMTCHQDNYDGWRPPMHPYQFQDAVPDAVIGDFVKNNTDDGWRGCRADGKKGR